MLFSKISIIIIVILFSCSCSDQTEFDQNTAPTAVFTYAPENADTSSVFTFDASKSSDSEESSNNLSYTWDFEGKHNWTDPVNDPIANFKYGKSGTFEVSLKVIDIEGWSGETTKTIIVSDTL